MTAMEMSRTAQKNATVAIPHQRDVLSQLLELELRVARRADELAGPDHKVSRATDRRLWQRAEREVLGPPRRT